MREIAADRITGAVRELCIDACYQLGEDVLAGIRKAREIEGDSVAGSVLGELETNAEIAREGEFPLCQDTGFAVILLELGQEVQISGGDLNEAVHEGVRQGYKDGYLRKSICDPFSPG